MLMFEKNIKIDCPTQITITNSTFDYGYNNYYTIVGVHNNQFRWK